MGSNDVALSWLVKAVQNSPDNPLFHYDLGNTLHHRGEINKAISCFQRVLQLDRSHVGAHYNLGNAFLDLGRMKEAVACYQQAVKLEPDYFEAYYNMGNALHDMENLDEAVFCFRKAVALKPHFPEPYFNMGIALQDQGNLQEAILSYQKAVELKPDYFEAYNHLVHQVQRGCWWEKLEQLTPQLENLTREALDKRESPPESPYTSLTRTGDPHRNFEIAVSWSNDIEKSVSQWGLNFRLDDRKSPKKTITVGYLSHDFRNHAIAHLTVSLFGLHDREAFKVIGYSYGENDGSYYRKRIEKGCDSFYDISDLNDGDAAKHIYDNEVDILVDLTGYTTGNRLAISALRPAPIQVSYLGLPGTTGADFFDYIITDRTVTPEEDKIYYSENFIYMPHCYQVNDHTQVIDQEFGCDKAHLGLPQNGFVFSSFNSPHKFDPLMFDTWMKILGQVPDSVLWLMSDNKTAEKNLGRVAKARGIEAERLIFAPNLPKGEHLARLSLAQLILDTRIYNGHTSTSDALWAGVPVITLKGTHFPSRVSSSILTAIGLPELITTTLKEYETLAVTLAGNPHALELLRQRLNTNRLSEPLFDTACFVRNLERAYKKIWEIFLAGEEPKQIEVFEE